MGAMQKVGIIIISRIIIIEVRTEENGSQMRLGTDVRTINSKQVLEERDNFEKKKKYKF